MTIFIDLKSAWRYLPLTWVFATTIVLGDCETIWTDHDGNPNTPERAEERCLGGGEAGLVSGMSLSEVPKWPASPVLQGPMASNEQCLPDTRFRRPVVKTNDESP